MLTSYNISYMYLVQNVKNLNFKTERSVKKLHELKKFSGSHPRCVQLVRSPPSYSARNFRWAK